MRISEPNPSHRQRLGGLSPSWDMAVRRRLVRYVEPIYTHKHAIASLPRRMIVVLDANAFKGRPLGRWSPTTHNKRLPDNGTYRIAGINGDRRPSAAAESPRTRANQIGRTHV